MIRPKASAIDGKGCPRGTFKRKNADQALQVKAPPPKKVVKQEGLEDAVPVATPATPAGLSGDEFDDVPLDADFIDLAIDPAPTPAGLSGDESDDVPLDADFIDLAIDPAQDLSYNECNV